MSTVPPNSNDDARDVTPDPDTPEAATDEAGVPSTPPPAATPDPLAGGAEPRGTTDVPDSELAGAAPPPAPGAADEPAAEPPAAPPVDEPAAAPVDEPPAGSPADTAPPTQTFGSPAAGAEPATRQLPTEEEDEALRAERARRFGRVASSGAEPTETGQPAQDADGVSGTAAGAGVAGAAAGAGAPAGTGAAGTSEVAGEPQTTTMATDGEAVPLAEDDPFADFDEGPRSRAAAHWWGILIAIVFGPVTWYLVSDGGERISYSLSQNLEAVNVMGLVELGGGLITLIIMLMAARWSSVGSIIIGSIATLIGAAFLIIPQIVADFLASQSMIFDRLGQFGTNIFDHLVSDGHSGRLLLYGITFIFVGVVSHGARRQGRREERRKAALEA